MTRFPITSGRPLTTLCFLVAVLVVSVAAANASARPAAKRAPTVTTITIVMPAVEGLANALYAHHKGFFRRQGLNAKITILTDPTQNIPALLSGEADFAGITVGGLALVRSRGVPVKMVASAALFRPLAPLSWLVVRRGSTVRGARDLIGKTVAIDSPSSIAHVAMRRWLKRNGVSDSRVEFRPLAFPQMLAPLARGEVDAATIPEPFLTMALQQGARRLSNFYTAVCPKICLLTLWMARKDQDVVVAAKFRNAVQAASVWADQKKNRRASAAILAKYAPIDAAVMRRMTRAYFAQRLVPRLGQPWIDAYAEFGLIQPFPAIQLVR